MALPGWSRSFPSQLRELIFLELENEMLLREALKLQLHRADRTVFERLLRDLDFLGVADGLSDRDRFERALSLGLHLDDEVVRQRLIFLMEQRLLRSSLSQRLPLKPLQRPLTLGARSLGLRHDSPSIRFSSLLTI